MKGEIRQVVAVSIVRTVGSAMLTVALSALLVVSLTDFQAYDGRYSSGLSLIVLACASTLLLFWALPIALMDCFLLWRRGSAVYASGDWLGLYQGGLWLPWRRGFVEVQLGQIEAVEVAGRSKRWGDLINLSIEGRSDLVIETFYMRGRTEDVVEALRYVVSRASGEPATI